MLPQETLALIPTTRWPSAFDILADAMQFLVHRPLKTSAPPKPTIHVPLDWAH